MQTAGIYFDDPMELPAFITQRSRKLQRRKDKRQLRTTTNQQSKSPDIKRINPLTENQRLTFEAFEADKNLLLHGVAGTGKTFIALYLSLQATIAGKAPKPIVILRSVVPSRDMGFLPGKMEEKIQVYEEPYRGLCAELSGKPTAYDYLKDHGFIQFSTTSYLRGLTFRNNTIIVDEAQNCNAQELNTIMTRVGEGCRVLVCADFTQTDLQRKEEQIGFHNFIKIAKKMPSFQHIEFTRNDICRSGFVKEYILAKEELGI